VRINAYHQASVVTERSPSLLADTSCRMFVGGGGLGDAVFIMNKFQKLSAEGDVLRFVSQQDLALKMVDEFFRSQGFDAELQKVTGAKGMLRSLKKEGAKILNGAWAGASWPQPWRLRTFPFDTVIRPYMDLRYEDPGIKAPYIVLQSNAGTTSYARDKNWRHAEWLESFAEICSESGVRCVLTGTEDLGLDQIKDKRINVPMSQLIGLIHGAKCIVGLQGFITIAALFMKKPVLLKKENVLVLLNHVHPCWWPHLHVFSEPEQPSQEWVNRLVDLALKMS
jgi:hypothetical protein